MDISQLLLIIATFLCTLVAGFVFAFAAVVMPGIRILGDGEFLRAFQVMDGVIQRGQPAFMAVWVGSTIVLIAAVAVGVGDADNVGRLLLGAAVVLYLFGVQLPTVTINIPLNNRVKALEIASLDATALAEMRTEFEARWNTSNVARTIVACVVSLLLLFHLVRI